VFGGRLAWLRQAWAKGQVVPIVSRETVSELLRVLRYPKFRLTDEDREALLGDYLPFAEIGEVSDEALAVGIRCRDPNDEMFIRLAISARADWLVSGDADLTDIGTLPVTVLLAEELRNRLQGAD
jgi:putative PIN family toxin of toxin-antitoxin system